MQKSYIINGIIFLIIGGLIGAGITYYQFRCKTSEVNIRLGTSPDNGAGVTITKTGDHE